MAIGDEAWQSAFWESGVEGEKTLTAGLADVLRVEVRTINQTFSDHPWDSAWLDGMQLPGICAVVDGMTQIGIDNKNPDGKDGSAITVKGYRPGPFEISCVLWTRAQWKEMQEILIRVWRRPQKGSKASQIAVPVYHPALALYDIASCVIQGVTFPTDGPFDGAKTIKFKCLENVPPGPKRQTKTATKTVTIDPGIKGRTNLGEGTVNDKPIPPSQNKKALGPRGAPLPPANGST